MSVLLQLLTTRSDVDLRRPTRKKKKPVTERESKAKAAEAKQKGQLREHRASVARARLGWSG